MAKSAIPALFAKFIAWAHMRFIPGGWPSRTQPTYRAAAYAEAYRQMQLIEPLIEGQSYGPALRNMFERDKWFLANQEHLPRAFSTSWTLLRDDLQMLLFAQQTGNRTPGELGAIPAHMSACLGRAIASVQRQCAKNRGREEAMANRKKKVRTAEPVKAKDLPRVVKLQIKKKAKLRPVGQKDVSLGYLVPEDVDELEDD